MIATIQIDMQTEKSDFLGKTSVLLTMLFFWVLSTVV